LRLILDEMYSPAIAQQLRRRGHDVEAITERPDLRAMPDDEVFAAAQTEGRTVVTENIADFIRASHAWEERDRPHHGLVLVDPRTFPRGSAATLGRMVTALEALLADRSTADSGSVWFLDPT